VPYNSERHALSVLDRQTFQTYGTDLSPNTLRTPSTHAALDSLDRTSEPLRTLWVKCYVTLQGRRCRYLLRYRQLDPANRYSCGVLSVAGSSLVTFMVLTVNNGRAIDSESGYFLLTLYVLYSRTFVVCVSMDLRLRTLLLHLQTC
jgi:hypothetical protein